MEFILFLKSEIMFFVEMCISQEDSFRFIAWKRVEIIDNYQLSIDNFKSPF